MKNDEKLPLLNKRWTLNKRRVRKTLHASNRENMVGVENYGLDDQGNNWNTR